MKSRLSIGLMVVAVLAAAFLAAHGPPVQAQPAGSIALPAPGSTEQLYPGCNNISLTFPDGTPSQTVVQAVTPAGAVETLWRFNASQNRFEGFSPAYPQASDLQLVYFLDAVWLCLQGAPVTGPQPAPTLTPAPPPPPPPAPPPGVTPTVTPTLAPPLTADLAVTHLFATASPAGDVRARITNNGPGTLTSVNVQLSCTVGVNPYGGIPSAQGAGFPITVSLTPGQTGEFGTGISVDTSHGWYDVTCTVQPSFNDPNTGNNGYSRTFPTTDLAVTDLFPVSLPQGDIRARVTNNGPDSLTNAEAQLSCSVNVHPYGGIPYGHGAGFPITVSLNPGQTGEFPTSISVDTTQAWYEVTCTVQPPFADPNPANDSYSETFPPPP